MRATDCHVRRHGRRSGYIGRLSRRGESQPTNNAMSHGHPYQQIGIVGTGRVAIAIGLALQSHSLQPVLIWGRSLARTAAVAASIGRARAEDDLQTLARACDLLILAVSDDALEACIEQLAKTSDSASGFVFHVSGKSGAALLAPLHARGWRTAAIHPAMTFTGNSQSEVEQMVGASFAVTGDSDAASEVGRAIVALLGGVPVDIGEAHRPLYHAALCHSANHLVTLIAGACDALAKAGADDPAALLAPLVRAALDNALARGMAGLSGPLLRGDVGTITGHLAGMGKDSPLLLPAYRAMALATLDAVKGQGHDMAILECRAVLEDGI